MAKAKGGGMVPDMIAARRLGCDDAVLVVLLGVPKESARASASSADIGCRSGY